jgi:hypothetical protein
LEGGKRKLEKFLRSFEAPACFHLRVETAWICIGATTVVALGGVGLKNGQRMRKLPHSGSLGVLRTNVAVVSAFRACWHPGRDGVAPAHLDKHDDTGLV